jgi:hypothetical protein
LSLAARSIFGWGDETPTVLVPIDEGWVRRRVLRTDLVAGRYEGVDETGTAMNTSLRKRVASTRPQFCAALALGGP